MKIRLPLALALIAGAALVSCGPAESIDRYMKALDALAPYYAPLVAKTGELGFFQQGSYTLLRSELSKNPRFLADLKHYYGDPERYFDDFHSFTLAYSCYTFQSALGGKSPADYLDELAASQKHLAARESHAGLGAAEKAAIEKKISQLQLIESRIREYESAAAGVKRPLLDEVARHSEELGALYKKVLSPPS